MLYYTGTFLVGAYWFGVPFPKLLIFSGIFWAVPIDYILYKKTMLGIFVYLFISKVTTTKVHFRFYKQYSQGATRLIWEWAKIRKIPVSFFTFKIPLYIEKISWKNFVRFWKWNWKRTPQSARNSFSRKSNLKVCIIFNRISYANA